MNAALAHQDRLAAPTEASDLPLLRIVSRDPDEGARQAEEPNPDRGTLVQARELAGKYPESAAAWVRLAQAEISAGGSDEAVAAALKGTRLAVQSGDTSVALAGVRVLTALGHVEVAERSLLALSSSDSSALWLAELAVARDDLETALVRIGSADDAASVALRGWLNLRLGKLHEAVRDLRKSARQLSPDPDVLANLGYAYALLGQHSSAIKHTRQAVHLAPSDTTISFNLVRYLLAVGDYEPALQELQRLRQFHPLDAKVAAAIAATLFQSGDSEAALKELKRTRDQISKLNLSVSDKAELTANIAFLEHRLGGRSREETVDVLRKELFRCDYKSRGIAEMLSSLLEKVSERDQLLALYEGLLEVYPQTELIGLECKLKYLEGDFEAATDLAMQWTKLEPFNAEAAVRASFLLSEVYGDYDRAAEVGRAFLRIAPTATVVRNNTAYALAMAGQSNLARKYVRHDDPDDPYSTATAALIDLAEGNVQSAMAGYEKAAELALLPEYEREPELPSLIKTQAYLVLRRFGYVDDELKKKIPALTEFDYPRIVLYQRNLEKEEETPD